MALRVEFSGQDHPVGAMVEAAYGQPDRTLSPADQRGAPSGADPRRAPARVVAQALVGALEGTTIAMAGQRPYDEEYAARVVTGVLGPRRRRSGDESARLRARRPPVAHP